MKIHRLKVHRYAVAPALAGLLGTAIIGGAAGPATAAPGPPAPGTPASGTPVHGPADSEPIPTDSERKSRLDIMFVGAHPDDEAGALSTFGQWNEYEHLRTGMVTITRGEGGGNAVGTEEGPALGLLREGEERRAVGRAGINALHYFDKVDFFYTVSAPLTADAWDHRESLGRMVRLIRQTRPKVVVTMDPGPIPFQHGNHQEAGRLAIEAYRAAADPAAFPGQITDEHLRPWRVARLFHQEHLTSGPTGPRCPGEFTPSVPSADIYGVWAGRRSARYGGKTWAQVEAEARREYASQGWATMPDAPTDPDEIGCDRFTQIDARVPFSRGAPAPPGSGTPVPGPAAMLEGALKPAPGGLPISTEFFLTVDGAGGGDGGEGGGDGFGVTPGRPFTVTAHARAARRLPNARVGLSVPAGWTVRGSGDLEDLGVSPTRDRPPVSVERTARFTVTPSVDAPTDRRVRIGATLHASLYGGGPRVSGETGRAVDVRAPVLGRPEPLARVTEFDAWAARAGAPQLSDRTSRVTMLGSGKSRELRVRLTNTGDETESGTVTIELPRGFAADGGEGRASRPYGPLAPGEAGSVTFTVTNTDPALPTSMQGGEYPYTLTTTSARGTDIERAAIELVPVTSIQEAAAAPTVDGRLGDGEYGAAPDLDLSRLWEGEACGSAADCSATARIARHGDDLYVLVRVRDDTLGTVLGTDDCKRHWRTDSVEIAIDPTGDSENTATTFKTGIFPTMSDGRPCFERDADNRQGPGPQTAPGMQVAASVDRESYDGYTVETKIPVAVLPGPIDPERMGLNLFVYDSDTQDKTGQTRIGWSTWGGVQGTPWRWGQAALPGYDPPGNPVTPPVIPSEAARSVNSPESILQAARIGVPLAAGPAAPPDQAARIVGRPVVTGDGVRFRLASGGAGTAHLYVWDGAVRGQKTVPVTGPGTATVTVPGSRGWLLLAFAAAGGGTASQAVRLR
jgi:LmbE family N-acetylglucosaminyl deacetylase